MKPPSPEETVAVMAEILAKRQGRRASAIAAELVAWGILDVLKERAAAIMEERDRWHTGYLVSCPWCKEPMAGTAISHQISHLIHHGDQFRAAKHKRIADALAAIRAARGALKLIETYPFLSDPEDEVRAIKGIAREGLAKADALLAEPAVPSEDKP